MTKPSSFPLFSEIKRVYAPVAELFKHSLGIVYLASNRESGGLVIVKLVERGASVTRHVASELGIHHRCSGHPFIIQLLDVFLTSRHLAIVLEHAPSGDALELVSTHGPLPEEEARCLFQQILMAIMHLHSLGAANRELKLENIFLKFPQDDGNNVVPTGSAHFSTLSSPPHRPIVKLQDFMYSKSEQINSDPHSALGSLPYTAPEILNNSMQEGTAADVWALGASLFKLTTGMFPFERVEDARDARRTVQAVLQRIASADYDIPESLSPDLRDLLNRMLVRIPEDRIRMEDIVKCPWVARDMPPEVIKANAMVRSEVCPLSEDALRSVIEEAQINLCPLNSDTVEDMADDILNEEEADDLLDELCLG